MDINTQPTNEVVQTEVIQPEVVTEPVVVAMPSTNWLKMMMFIVVGIGLLVGAVYGGMQIGKLQTPQQQLPVVLEPTAVPEQVETSPTEEASPSALPGSSSPSAAIPAD